MNVANNPLFFWLVICGIFDLIVNVICIYLISVPKPGQAVLTEVMVTLLYLLQAAVPHALFCYIVTLFSSVKRGKMLRLIPCIVFPVVMGLMILSNHWTHLFFTVDSGGIYSRGPLYAVMYSFAGIYLVTSLICSLIHAKELGSNKVRAILELFCATFVTIIIQYFYNDLLLSGFGITIGITVLFFTLNNPYRYTDTLTLAYDIHYFRDRYKRKSEKHRRIYLFAVELSQLKHINLVRGTRIGNLVLVTVSKLLRSGDKRNLVFRISGKRFLVMANTSKEYDTLCKRLIDFCSDPILIPDGDYVGCPVNICGLKNTPLPEDSDTVLSYVEYLFSLHPQVTETCFSESTDENLKGFRYNKEVENYIGTAIEQDLFEVEYQPIYSLSEHRFVTVEALSRLRHPTLGNIPPDVFISLAEKADKVAQIGLMQLERVCRFLKANPVLLHRMQNIKFNLSPAELMKPGHAFLLLETIRKYGIPLSFFQFEITETVATEYIKNLNQISRLFTSAGIGLCLDDFGSGFANLNTVMKLPFKIIKLDRSMLSGICENHKVASLYQSMVSASHHLDFTVVSEGVETGQEFELLKSWGVDMIQGYYFSKPLPEEELLRLPDFQPEN